MNNATSFHLFFIIVKTANLFNERKAVFIVFSSISLLEMTVMINFLLILQIIQGLVLL